MRRTPAVSSSTSQFGQNQWLVDEMYLKFQQDPSSVDESWHEFLADYTPEANSDAGDNGRTTAPASGAATSQQAAATSQQATAPATKTAPAPEATSAAAATKPAPKAPAPK